MDTVFEEFTEFRAPAVPAGFIVDLSFRATDSDDTDAHRQLDAVDEAFCAIANTDGRLKNWLVTGTETGAWINVRALVTSHHPGEVAALGEQWMSVALNAALTPSAERADRIPDPRTPPRATDSEVTAQVQVGN